jgi:hypothetical protein
MCLALDLARRLQAVTLIAVIGGSMVPANASVRGRAIFGLGVR